MRVEAGVDPATGHRRQVYRTVRGTKREADEVLARLLIEVGQGEHVGHDATVGQLLEAWMSSAALSPTTRRDYRSAIARHLGPLAGEKVWRVRAHHVDRLYGELAASGLGAARIRRVHTILRRAYRQAVRWGWVARNPVIDASPPPVVRGEIHPPSVAEMRALIAGASTDLVTWLRLDAGLGARRGEVCGLQWRDVDLDAGEITIRRGVVDGGPGVGLVVQPTKTHRERTVALDRPTIIMLREHRRHVAAVALAVGRPLAADAFVFSREPDGSRPWRPDWVNKRFDRLRRATRLSHISPHDLRHFVATQMLAAGVDPRTVAGRLGHARPSTTLDVYAAFVPARDRGAADGLGELLG